MARIALAALAATLTLAGSAHAMPLGKTKLVSKAVTSGPGGNATSYSNYGENYDQAISDNGRYVTFLSDAHNLQSAVADDGTSRRLFQADLFTGLVRMVDVNAAGTGNATGLPTPNNGYPVAPSASADGRYVLWHSGAQNLVSGFVDGGDTTDAEPDVWMRDMQTGTTTLVSRTAVSDKHGGNKESSYPVVTPDGRYVVWYSNASNLTSDSDTNNGFDLFRRDMQTGTTELITQNATNTGAMANAGSDYYAITPDGRYVAFSRIGAVSDLIAGGTGSGFNVYVRDMVADTTELASPTTVAPTAGAGSVDSSEPPFISDDGRFVVYQSTATTMVSESDGNAARDVFLRDLTADTTTLVSEAAAGGAATDGSSTWARITPDGRYVSFVSSGTSLVASPADTAGRDVFRYDRVAGTNTVISVKADGTGSSGGVNNNEYPVMSSDGRYVVFSSAAGSLVSGFTDSNAGGNDVYKRDMEAGITSLVSSVPATATTSGDASAAGAWITPDGRFVTFASQSTTLVSPATSGAFVDFYARGNFLPAVSIASAPGADTFSFGFTGTATDPDGTVSSLGWLFGDGASASGATTSHTYATAGAKTVTLTATDDEGEAVSTTATVNPTAPASTPPVTTPPVTTPPVTTPPVLTVGTPNLLGGTVEVNTKGRFALRLSCPAGGGACKGNVKVRTARAVSAAKKRILALAAKSYSVPAGMTKRVRLTLSAKGRKLLKRTGRIRARATFAPTGGGTKTTRKLTLKKA